MALKLAFLPLVLVSILYWIWWCICLSFVSKCIFDILQHWCLKALLFRFWRVACKSLLRLWFHPFRSRFLVCLRSSWMLVSLPFWCMVGWYTSNQPYDRHLGSNRQSHRMLMPTCLVFWIYLFLVCTRFFQIYVRTSLLVGSLSCLPCRWFCSFLFCSWKRLGPFSRQSSSTSVSWGRTPPLCNSISAPDSSWLHHPATFPFE